MCLLKLRRDLVYAGVSALQLSRGAGPFDRSTDPFPFDRPDPPPNAGERRDARRRATTRRPSAPRRPHEAGLQAAFRFIKGCRVRSARRKSDEDTPRRFSLTSRVVDRRAKRANKRWNYRCQVHQAVHFQSSKLEIRLFLIAEYSDFFSFHF